MIDGYRTQLTLDDRKIDWARKSSDDERLSPCLSLQATLLLSGAIWAGIMAMVYAL
jgi:hypothetical protein